MSETVAPRSDPEPAPSRLSTADERASRPADAEGGGALAIHLIAGLVMGSVAPYLVLLTSASYAVGLSPYGFVLADVTPQIVALVALGIALLSRVRGAGWLRSSGWLVAAAGLFGVSALYAQSTLDGRTLTLALTVVIALQFVGLLLAFARADGPSQWAVAIGLAAGISGGREAVYLIVRALRNGPFAGGPHGDDVLFAALGVLVGTAGVVLLVLRRPAAEHRPWPSAWWPVVGWPVVAVVTASVLAVALTRAENARLDGIVQSYIGGISEQDALALQTQDLLIRLGIAVLVAVPLMLAAQRCGGPAVIRWVLVAFGTALVLVGLSGFMGYRPSWSTALLAAGGVAVGVVLVHRVDRILPWDALGLVLAAGLLVHDTPAAARYVGAFGIGLAVAAGIGRLTPPPGSRSPARLGPGRAAVALALGLAGWVFGHQVVVPPGANYRSDLGGLPILSFGILFFAGATVAGFILDRRSSRA